MLCFYDQSEETEYDVYWISYVYDKLITPENIC